MSEPRSYRLTRPDDIRFFHRRSGIQFAICCAGIGLGLLAVVVKALATGGRIGLGIAGAALAAIALSRTPNGEDVLELLPIVARFCLRRLRGKAVYTAALLPYREASLPPLFSGIELLDVKGPPDGLGASFRHVGVVLDRADGSVSVVLRLHSSGFLLSDPSEQEARLSCFGDALASLSRDGGAITRIAWSQSCVRAGIEASRADLEQHGFEEADADLRASYVAMLESLEPELVSNEVLVTLSTGRHGGSESQIADATSRLLEEVGQFRSALSRAQINVVGPLPAGAIARSLRDRLDPSARRHLERRALALPSRLGLITPENAFPLHIEERQAGVRADDSWHRIYRVAEWPKLPVRADWLAPFLCEREVTRSMTVVLSPQPRRVARRDASAVATRVGASIEAHESHGRRVGADQRRAHLAAEALDEELEHGAELEVLIGLVDVVAPSLAELDARSDALCSHAASLGLELRSVPFRHGEALVAALPLGRVVAGRTK